MRPFMVYSTGSIRYVMLGMLLWFCRCNSIPNSTQPYNQQTSPEYEDYRFPKTYKIDSLIIFNIIPNSLALFSGTKTCSLFTGQTCDSAYSDSLYYRIHCGGDTLCEVDDSLYGIAQIVSSDVHNWDALFRTTTSGNFLGTLILAGLSSVDSSSIIACTSSVQLSAENKSAIINSLNGLLDSLDFYYNYWIEIFDYFPEQYSAAEHALYEHKENMVARGIFLDMFGTLKSPLSALERERVRWFNRCIIASYLNDNEVSYLYGRIFKRYPSHGRLFSFSFQQGTTKEELPDNNTIRLFLLHTTGLQQLAYTDGVTTETCRDKKIHDYPYITDTSWTVSPLYFLPSVPFCDANTLKTLMLPGKGVLRHEGYSYEESTYKWMYALKLYYPVSGNVVNDGSNVRVSGLITVTISYYNRGRSLLFNSNYQGIYTRWSSETIVQMNADNGVERTYRENAVCNIDSLSYSVFYGHIFDP